jgi:hypothetical protein
MMERWRVRRRWSPFHGKSEAEVHQLSPMCREEEQEERRGGG